MARYTLPIQHETRVAIVTTSGDLDEYIGFGVLQDEEVVQMSLPQGGQRIFS